MNFQVYASNFFFLHLYKNSIGTGVFVAALVEFSCGISQRDVRARNQTD